MKKKVYAYLHTHWDREWYREFEEFRLRLVEVFDDVLNKLESNEIPSFYFDGQTSALEDYLEIKPEKEYQIKKYIKEKRLFIGPYYCSTDSFLVDTESLIKNLQIGIKQAQSKGCEDYIAYHADTFGHSAHIPHIIKYFSIDNAIFWRGLGELNSEFLFNGLKSTYLIEGYFHDYFSTNTSYEQKAQMLKRTLDRIANYSSNNILLPIGADHLAIPEKIEEQVKEINKLLDDYQIVITTPFEYLKSVKNIHRTNINNEFRNTKRNFILPGVLSSRLDIKQQNAKSQWLISRIAQPLQAIDAYLNKGHNYQSAIDNLHKKLIQNHAHDSIYGCSIDNVHKSNIAKYKEVNEGINAVINTVKRNFFSESGLSIINLSNYDFSGAIRIKTTKRLDKKYNAQLISESKGFPLTKLYRTNEIPITEDFTSIYEYLIDTKQIEALSTKCLNTKDIEHTSSLRITNKSIENAKIKLSIKNDKIELLDKKTNTVYKDFINFIDRADIGDSYNFGALSGDKPLIAQIIKTKIKEQGHIRNILEIDFELRIPVKSKENGRSKITKKHTLKTQVILENQNDYIEFNIDWNNKSLDHILQVEFKLNRPITNTISDDLCGYTERAFDLGYDIYKDIPAPRGIELKTNTAPIQKSVWTQGVGLITEGLTEYEVANNKLLLTLLRATGTISNPKNPTRGTPAGPPLPTPDLQMLGRNTARFGLCFSNTVQELQPNIEKFYQATILIEASLDNCRLLQIANKNVEISTIKTDKNNNLIVRLINKSNNKEKLNIETELIHSRIYELDALEQSKKEFAPTIDANSFKTILIKR